MDFLQKLFSTLKIERWGSNTVKILRDQHFNCIMYLFKLPALSMDAETPGCPRWGRISYCDSVTGKNLKNECCLSIQQPPRYPLVYAGKPPFPALPQHEPPLFPAARERRRKNISDAQQPRTRSVLQQTSDALMRITAKLILFTLKKNPDSQTTKFVDGVMKKCSVFMQLLLLCLPSTGTVSNWQACIWKFRGLLLDGCSAWGPFSFYWSSSGMKSVTWLPMRHNLSLPSIKIMISATKT